MYVGLVVGYGPLWRYNEKKIDLFTSHVFFFLHHFKKIITESNI